MSPSSKYETPVDVKVSAPHLWRCCAGRPNNFGDNCPHPTTPNKTVTAEIWVFPAPNPSTSYSCILSQTLGHSWPRAFPRHAPLLLPRRAAILCFDMTRKITYKNLGAWFEKLSAFRGLTIPVVVVTNKVDMDSLRARARALG
ncbi:hypothetical protein BC830DRAFT_92506 [Chytriomyces sp. MP71]|nr:hypothetical protein BC830DRAFT_92506 [Chytriomyces sp. MP71]